MRSSPGKNVLDAAAMCARASGFLVLFSNTSKQPPAAMAGAELCMGVYCDTTQPIYTHARAGQVCSPNMSPPITQLVRPSKRCPVANVG